MTSPVRVTVVMTHPVQYMSPWFRHVAAERTDLDLTVLYGAVPDREQQGAGFGTSFTWDVPLTDGYRYEVCSDGHAASFGSDSYRGIDVPDIGRRIEQTRPDVVLVPGWHSIAYVRALKACRRMGVPVLYRGDSSLVSGPRGVLRPAWALRTRRMLRRFDGYLAVGTHAVEYLRAFGVAEPSIVRSPHCVDNGRFAAESDRLRLGDGRAAARRAIGAAADDFVVLFAGKFQDIKRPLDAVRAVARLGPRAVLMMAGDGVLRKACQAEAERRSVRLAWVGFINQSELPSAFAAADCLLLPSARETWGLVVNEALASGVPCVVTDGVGCAPELIVPGETGYVVHVGDIAAMADSLRAIRGRLAEGREFAADCRRRAETCSLAAAADGLAAGCRRVLSQRIATDADTRVVACCGGMVSVFGMERASFEVLRALRGGGAAIHCIVNSWSSAPIADLAATVGASWTPGHYTVGLRWRRASPREAVRLVAEIVRVSAVLLRECRRARATHVFVPDLAGALYNLPALAWLRATGTRVVVRLGNAPEPTALYRFLWGSAIDRVTTQFVTNSRFTAGALAADGVPAHKIRTIPVPPPTRDRTAPHAERGKQRGRIIYVGQLIPPKGCDRLLEAVARLVSRGYDVSLDVIGDLDRWEPEGWAGYIASLRERAARPDLAGRVRLLGAREDVPEMLASAAIHCFPSLVEIREGFGIVAVEAKAAGIPSVVTPSGALPELISHREDGFICRDDSTDALAEGLEYFLVDPERLAAAGRRAEASARNFTRERIAAEWLDVFRMSVAAAGRAPEPAAMVHSHGE